jgi:hypothetical protein
MYTGRTKKYAEALAREGKDFNYRKWLRQVNEEEAREKRIAAASNLRPEANDVAKGAQISAPPKDRIPAGEVNDAQTSNKPTPRPGSLKSAAPKKSLRQRLVEVCNAWDELQQTRDRDAVYDYLRAVFSIVQHYGWNDRTKKLVRRAFKFAGLPVDKNADPFAVVIRCTCDQQLDRKTISKWSRALRYTAGVKKRTPLKTFMKNKGGINACADLYTKHFGPGER